jgi:riboflavin kinase/FMN adenylyltransferase
MAKLHRTVDKFDGSARGGAISIGNFDGVHRGHALLAARLCAMAERLGGPSVAITFDPAPAVILRPEGVPAQLTTIERRTELLGRCGIDHVVICKTDRELLNQTAEQFFSQLVIEKLCAKGMIEGPNFYFGRNRQGDTKRLRELCEANSIRLEIVAPQTDTDSLISSTRVRELLTVGNVEAANRLLTAEYQVEGEVIEGASRGRKLGFPTANLANVKTLVPGAGVYACRVWLDSKRSLPAATHIGPNPTFAEERSKLEVHLIDYAGDLYGETFKVDFVSRVRGVMKFESPATLTEQLARDIAEIRTRLAATCSPN